MAVAVTYKITPALASYPPGTQITFTYTVTGADDVPAKVKPVPVTSFVTVNGSDVPANGTINVDVPAVINTKVPSAPVVGGVTLKPTADPMVWTGATP